MTYPQYSTESFTAAEEAVADKLLRRNEAETADLVAKYSEWLREYQAAGKSRSPSISAPRNRKPRQLEEVALQYVDPIRRTPMSDVELERPPKWTKLELEKVLPLREVEDLTSLDRDTLTRVYRPMMVKLSPKRWGMKFRNVLRIINGDAAA